MAARRRPRYARRAIGPELVAIADAVRARNARLAGSRMRRQVEKFSQMARDIDAAASG